MPNKPETSLEGTKTLAAMREMLEDRLAECVAHMQDPTTLEGKPCTITLKAHLDGWRQEGNYR
jgi:coenzyme F420-reducing hydrogenase beta subunit